MATEAQIQANRANAQKSRGPTTDEGKARARLNALKHGMRAEVSELVAPREDPAELTARIQAWLDDYQPTGVVERDLVERAARLSWDLDRAQRYESAILAQRVRAAMLNHQAERAAEVAGLARKLLYLCGKRNVPGSGPPWDDEPRVFALALEASPEGTRWMIERWTEIRLLLDSGAAWSFPDQYKFIRLLGKHPVDAVDDPELNAIVLAWEAITENWGAVFWGKTRDETPSDNPAFNAWRAWRALVPPLESPEAGWAHLRSIVDRELERLTERLAILEEVEGTDALELAERALFCASDGAERLRRFQTARTRELLRTLDAIAKLRKAAAGVKTAKKAPNEAENAPERGREGEAPAEPHTERRLGGSLALPKDRPTQSAGSAGASPFQKIAQRKAPARREPRPPGKPFAGLKTTKNAPNEANPAAAENTDQGKPSPIILLPLGEGGRGPDEG